MALSKAELKHAAKVAERVSTALSLYHVRFEERLGWADLAQIFGWSQPTQSEVSTGKRPLRVHELLLIGMRLAVDVGWLVTGEGAKESNAPPVKPPAVKAPNFRGTPVARSGAEQAAKRVNRRTK